LVLRSPYCSRDVPTKLDLIGTISTPSPRLSISDFYLKRLHPILIATNGYMFSCKFMEKILIVGAVEIAVQISIHSDREHRQLACWPSLGVRNAFALLCTSGDLNGSDCYDLVGRIIVDSI
jgi:hypothetical protein